jgi:hypothetical protein
LALHRDPESVKANAEAATRLLHWKAKQLLPSNFTMKLWQALATLGGALAVLTLRSNIPFLSSPAQAQAAQRWLFEASIHPDSPPLTFVLQGYQEDDREPVNRILIYDGAALSRNLQQTIVNLEAWSYDLTNGGFVVEDLDFDGYADLRLQEFLPASPNVPYLYWLYDPQTEQFVFNEALRVITLPEVDPDTQTLRSFTRVNALTYEVNDYQFIDGTLTLVRQEINAYSPTTRHVIIKERRAGELVVVEEFWEPVAAP